MTFIRKNRAADRAARKTSWALAPIPDERPNEAMRSVVALTAAGWNSLRHAC
jgi:hypothetical protein